MSSEPHLGAKATVIANAEAAHIAPAPPNLSLCFCIVAVRFHEAAAAAGILTVHEIDAFALLVPGGLAVAVVASGMSVLWTADRLSVTRARTLFIELCPRSCPVKSIPGVRRSTTSSIPISPSSISILPATASNGRSCSIPPYDFDVLARRGLDCYPKTTEQAAPHRRASRTSDDLGHGPWLYARHRRRPRPARSRPYAT